MYPWSLLIMINAHRITSIGIYFFCGIYRNKVTLYDKDMISMDFLLKAMAKTE
jgi:hypothetical protein